MNYKSVRSDPSVDKEINEMHSQVRKLEIPQMSSLIANI